MVPLLFMKSFQIEIRLYSYHMGTHVTYMKNKDNEIVLGTCENTNWVVAWIHLTAVWRLPHFDCWLAGVTRLIFIGAARGDSLQPVSPEQTVNGTQLFASGKTHAYQL
jgi:hypothetical protein